VQQDTRINAITHQGRGLGSCEIKFVIKFQDRPTRDSETVKYLNDIRHFDNYSLEDISVYFYRSRGDRLYRKDSAPEKVLQQYFVIIYDLAEIALPRDRFEILSVHFFSLLESSRSEISRCLIEPESYQPASRCLDQLPRTAALLRERSFSNWIPVNPLIVLDSYRLDRRTSARDGSGKVRPVFSPGRVSSSDRTPSVR